VLQALLKGDMAALKKRFINKEADIVQESMEGCIITSPGVGRLDGYPDIKVVFRNDWQKDKVALVSGGGAGHEPMHGGFVGSGMLAAAISGETFASPTIDAVLAAIVQVTGPAGCLLIIKNYTGDRLNFTLAAQRARLEFGLKVETVITCDDVATSAERGIAGTLFVHKIAGAAAEAGKSLEEVKACANAVIDASASLGVSFTSVLRLKENTIGEGQMEVGLGIHGEPGARTVDIAPVSAIVDILMEGILAGKRMAAESPHGYAVLINNLGGVPALEMGVFPQVLMKSRWASSLKLLIGPAPLCTSLDMNGMSLSLLRLSPELESYLVAPTAVRAWPGALAPVSSVPAKVCKIEDIMNNITASQDEAVKQLMTKVCKALIDAKQELDELDGKVGDADCGSTMASAGGKVLEAIEKLPLADPAATCRCLSSLTGRAMGGSSGVLLSIMFMGMATFLEASGKNSWSESGAKAFMSGLQAMMDAGGAGKGSRTMLDALVPAAEALVAGGGLAAAKTAAVQGAEATKLMPPLAGRSENVPESVWKGVTDPGAQAAVIVFSAIA